jgi:hypothetical protein
MFKKIFYSLTILAMLFGMFGVMGNGGVQKAAAFSTNALIDVIPPAGFPGFVALDYHAYTASFIAYTVDIGQPATSCIGNAAAPSAWYKVWTGFNTTNLHVHSNSQFNATIAVFADVGGLGAELGCANSTGVINNWNADLVIPVGPNTSYYVYIIPRAFGVDAIIGPADQVDLWVAQFQYGGGIIANLCVLGGPWCDAAGEPIVNATAQAQLSTGGTIYTDGVDAAGNTLAGLGNWTSNAFGDLFIDVPDAPAGADYWLGISSVNDTNHPLWDFIWFVPHVVRWIALDPVTQPSFFDSLGGFANHSFATRSFGPLNAFVSVAVAGGAMPNFQLPLGQALGGTTGFFRIIPGGFYDFQAVANNVADAGGANTDYYLINTNVDCLNVTSTCPLAFNTNEGFVPPVGAIAHASIHRHRNVPSFTMTDFAVGTPGTNFAYGAIFGYAHNDDIVVSTSVPLYMDAVAVDTNGDRWVMRATAPGPIPMPLPENTIATRRTWRLLWDTDGIDGLGELNTTMTSTGLIPSPNIGLLLGTAIANEVPWTSAAGNTVTADYALYTDSAGNILIPASPMDYYNPQYFPDWAGIPELGLGTALLTPPGWHHRAAYSENTLFTLAPFSVVTSILGKTALAVVDPAYAAGPITGSAMGIGRFIFWRCISYDRATSDVNVACPGILYAISPTDNRMGGAWSWSWVEGLYEMGLTTGTAPGVYSPEMTISRSEMAVFLSRLLSFSSVVPAAPAATGTVYTDVAAGQWAASWIEQLNAYNIAGDCDAVTPLLQFCPNSYVTRAEMAKFIEKTYRVAVANGFNWIPWLPSGFSSGTWWPTNINVVTPGVIFVDVPADNWAAIWTDEMWLDGLTEGCRTEMSGVTWIHYYCPNDFVTRAQMAKFVVSAYAPAGFIQQFWPILAPER